MIIANRVEIAYLQATVKAGDELKKNQIFKIN